MARVFTREVVDVTNRRKPAERLPTGGKNSSLKPRNTGTGGFPIRISKVRLAIGGTIWIVGAIHLLQLLR
jgi:hypothetical protein